MSRSIEERLVRRYLRAKKHTAEFELRAARGQWRRALSANRHAVRQASRLKAEDPANPEHGPVLASLLYGQAMVLHQLRRGKKAVWAARGAVDLYDAMDPTHGDYLLVKQTLDARPHLEQHVGQAADARARLYYFSKIYPRHAWLGAGEIHLSNGWEGMNYGLSSVMIYVELLAHGHLFDQSDYERVHGSWLAAGGEG